MTNLFTISNYFQLSTDFDHSRNEVDHLTFWDTLFGNEEAYMVCYPKDHQSFFLMIIILSAISLGLAIYIFYSYRKYNRQLKRASELISKKNEEMIDSIRYAKRIQGTILPTTEEFSKIVPNGFVIYRPKDIVSGDFYWVHKKNELTIFAVIDCTGHGVPGSFLSLIGSNALSRVVKEESTMEPQVILHKMNDYVKSSLRQMEAGDMRDGMEVSIAVYDSSKNKIDFAGARMNLIHCRNGEINILKGSKLTVGTVEEHVSGPPEKIAVDVQAGDAIYLYSDGVVDQFGSNDRGKYKLVRLKKLISKIASLDMNAQQTKFNTTFDEWMGEEEQIDDLTLLGVRL